MIKISKDMDAENIYILGKHYGVLIWLITVILSCILFGYNYKMQNQENLFGDK